METGRREPRGLLGPRCPGTPELEPQGEHVLRLPLSVPPSVPLSLPPTVHPRNDWWKPVIREAISVWGSSAYRDILNWLGLGTPMQAGSLGTTETVSPFRKLGAQHSRCPGVCFVNLLLCCACGGQRTTMWTGFSSSTFTWVPGVNSGHKVCTSHASTH